MHSRSQHRRRKATRTTVLVLLAGSAMAHAALVATLDVSASGAVSSARKAELADARVAPDWTFTCQADAALAAGVRLGACGSPFGGELERCVADALAQLTVDRALCASPSEAEVQVAFVDVDQLDLMPVPLMAEVPPVDDVVAAQLIEEEVARKLEEAQQPVETPKAAGQIIEITRPEVESAPSDARYLSEYDTKVDKQTVARGSTEEMVARPQPKELPPAPTAPETPPDTAPPAKDGAPGEPGEQGRESMLAMRDPSRGPETPAKAGTAGDRRGAELASSSDGFEPRRGEEGQRARSGGGGEIAPRTTGEGGEGGVKQPELRPSEELLARAIGGGSVDHIEDAERGDFTALNSRKWKFAGFFNRMKRQVAQNWHPDQVYLRRDPSGKVYGTKDRITVLHVSLTPNGQVAKVYVAKPSGVDFLDEEAVRAFREAQPFPNPPGGLVDSRSNLITFSFGFHFQIGGDRSKWRIFRQN
jgi:TonB family protein